MEGAVKALFQNLKKLKKLKRDKKIMNEKLNPKALGIAGAIVSAIGMLLLGILGNIGIYRGAVQMMQQWHMFFDLSIIGIITGMVEAAVITFIFAYVLAIAYNRFA